MSKAQDVRDVLERSDVFAEPYGADMMFLTGGEPFILGMQGGEAYRKQKSRIMSAFEPSKLRAEVARSAGLYADEIVQRAMPGFDVVEDLIRRVPQRVMRDVFGLEIADEQRFADWSIAGSAVLFADFRGKDEFYQQGLTGAERIKDVIDRSVDAIRHGTLRLTEGFDPRATVLARLMEMEAAGEITRAEIHAMMIGMIVGYGPTNILADGNVLETLLRHDEMRRIVVAAVRDEDDERLEGALLEALRFDPIRLGPHRIALRDYVIAAGTSREATIKEGTVVFASTLGAMFDPENVTAPMMFDPDRTPSNSMVFGHGLHWCIGAPIARATTVAIFKALFSRTNLRRVPGCAGRMRRDGPYPAHMPVTFDLREEVYGESGQSLVTVALPVPRDDEAAVREALDLIGNPMRADFRKVFDDLGEVHFVSATLTRDGQIPYDTPAHLVIEMSGDGVQRDVIASFARAAPEPLRATIQKIADGEMETALNKHALNVSPAPGGALGLTFCGTPGHSVGRIKAEAALEERLRHHVTEAPGEIQDAGPLPLLDHVRKEMKKETTFGWAFRPVENALAAPIRGFAGIFRHPVTILVLLALAYIGIRINLPLFDPVTREQLMSLHLASWLRVGASMTMFLVGTALILATIIAAVLFFLRRRERSDPEDASFASMSKMQAVTALEDFGAQNHLAAVSILKPSRLRRVLLRAVFFVIGVVATFRSPPGTLSGIPTIHFARWVVLPKTDQLLFFSNYGGSWESYLEDFITKASAGLTGVWSNTIGFPRARNLFQDGATSGTRFKRWARRQQIPTRMWYSAYPDLTTSDIRKNAAIRDGFAKADNAQDASYWLCQFGSLAKPEESLEIEDIQGLLFGPMGKLHLGRLLALTLPEKNDPRLLEFLVSRTHFGDRLAEAPILQLAFSWRGLLKMNLGNNPEGDHGYGFSHAFREGMASATRQRILGDRDGSAPDAWHWGQEGDVDLVVMIYAAEEAERDALYDEVLETAERHGCTRVSDVFMNLSKTKPHVEPFGFADGISQPVIRGTPRSFRNPHPDHVISAGEVLCGYPDDRGITSPSPAVLRNSDPQMILPQYPGEEFGYLSDFGRNGAYLVIRELWQHADAFHGYCKTQAARLNAKHARRDITQDWVAAKIVGRWQNGSSLLRHPYKPGDERDNDFRFGNEDPQGLRCPLGAHIRRANPRDSLGVDRDAQVGLSNRHRILRVGRNYQRGEEEGLMFMCLNADLERQFEFIQQTWMNNSGFHGVKNEHDPLVANNSAENQYVIPTRQGGMVLNGFKPFVTTRGGGYFFMPGRRALLYLKSRLFADAWQVDDQRSKLL
ncbi:cytochrome P450 [Paracoccaceae bacterium GXU_MW_L88]